MGLTRVKISNIDSTEEYFVDPLIILNKESTTANLDVGFIFNRDGGTSANTAIVWNEANSTFAMTYITSTGTTNSNIAITSYANLKVGNITATKFIGDGSSLTGVASNYSNTNVASYLTTYTGTFGNISSLSVAGTSSHWGAATFYNGITGTLQTAAQTAITSVGTLTGLTVSGAITVNSSNVAAAIINGGATGVGNIGSSTTTFNTVFAKATTAQYADLAENYTSDRQYEPGTVVIFGGINEVTISTETHDPSIAGVVSTNPAYLMNDTCDGVSVALQGRVPSKVQGPVKKGDRLVSSTSPGVACKLDKTLYEPGCIIGKALSDITDNSIQTIEVVVGRV